MYQAVTASLFRGLGLALGFLTRLPIPHVHEPRRSDFAWALFWFPAVGALLGVSLVPFAWGGAALELGVSVQAALVVTLLALLTGGLHLDGLADTVDGLSGGRDHKARLEIMKDSRIGAHGAVSIVLLLLVKFALIAEWLHFEPVWGSAQALIIAPVTARLVAVCAVAWFPYARATGLGAAFKEASRITLPAFAGCWLLPLFLWPQTRWVFVVAGAVSLGLGLLSARLISKKLHGLTGDTYGALIECTEVFALLALRLAYSALGRD